jgi:5-formyltetrahydrofolate cyclo-ligase
MYFGGEVQLDSLFPICWEGGKRTCIPVYNEVLKIYEMAEITPTTEFITGHYGIREPVSPQLVPLSEIDLITVPGIAFDRSGNRLGRGGGFYDRMLSSFEGSTIAVAFDFQIYDQVPVEPHDKPVHAVITEIKVLNV